MTAQNPARSEPRITPWLAHALPVLLTVCLVITLGARSQAANAAAPPSWATPTTIDPGHALSAISCPAAPPSPEALCAVVDNAGNVLTSTDPGGGVSAWQSANIDSSTPLTGVSCEREACIAVDGLGNVLISRHVGGGASTWTKTLVDAGNGGLTGVSCPLRDGSQVEFCLAVDDAGNAVISFDPTGGSSAWKAEHIDAIGGHLTGLSCTEFSEWCIAWDDLGNVVTSGEPAEGASTWSVASIDPGTGLTGASCPYVRGTGYYAAWEYCLGVDPAGNVLAASKPTGGAGAWTASHVEAHGLTGVSCPFVLEAYFCAAVDEVGNAVTSSNPLGGAADWGVTPIDPGNELTGISCPYSDFGLGTFCVAIAANGDVIVGIGAGEEPPHEEHHEASKETGRGGSVTGSSPPGSGSGTITAISTAQIAASLKQIIPSGKAARIAALLKHGGLRLPFKALETGTVAVGWYLVPSGAILAKATKAKPILVASGKLTFSGAGTGKLKIRLTAAGRQLLRRTKRVKLMARGTFAPKGGAAVSTISGFRLKW